MLPSLFNLLPTHHTHSHHTHTTHTTHTHSGSSGDHEKWSKGLITATAQNFARELMETPSNHMTPTMFVDTVSSHLGNIRISSGTKLEVVPRFANHCLHELLFSAVLHVAAVTLMIVHTYFTFALIKKFRQNAGKKMSNFKLVTSHKLSRRFSFVSFGGDVKPSVPGKPLKISLSAIQGNP